MLLSAALTYFAIASSHVIVSDESVAYDQITHFLKRGFEIDTRLAVPPGYHALIASLAWPFGVESLNGLRLISLLVNLWAIPIFLTAARLFDPNTARVRACQLFYLPILLPFCSLLYTDYLALTLFMLAFTLGVGRQPHLAGLAALASILVRQTQIVWVAFLLVWLFPRESGGHLSWPALGRHLLRHALLVLLLAGFAAFVLIRRGVALGAHSTIHPLGMVYTSNVFFSLFVASVLFLPLFVLQTPAMFRLLRHHPWVVLLLAGLLAIYLLTWRSDHEMNQLEGYLRNDTLAWVGQSRTNQLLFFLPIAWASLGLAVTPLRRREDYLLYPFWVLTLLPIWLIEQRYYLSSFALLVLLRQPASGWRERLLLGWWVVLSAGVLVVLCRFGMFL
jgi:alpha-1,2-glucosyltransferase